MPMGAISELLTAVAALVGSIAGHCQSKLTPG
jgi:hypothetical protein